MRLDASYGTFTKTDIYSMASFCEIAREEFNFLQNECGYEIIEVTDRRDGGVVKYKNVEAGIGVDISYESRCAFVFVFICRLVNGNLLDNPRQIENDTDINCFDFNDYLQPDMKMRPAYEYGEDSKYYDPQDGLRYFIREFAHRLRTNGLHILKGDLAMLPEMASIIKRRAESFKHN